MAKVVVFPDQESCEFGLEVCPDKDIRVEPLAIPVFCAGLAPPCLVSSGDASRLCQRLYANAVPIAGVIPYYPIRREIPQAEPPNPLWKEIVGGIRFVSVRPSVSDPGRLRVEAVWDSSISDLIPIMARFIRGGVYDPSARVLGFEEEHRLLVFSSGALVISRADDLLDLWVMLRSSIELIHSAWDRRHHVEPDLAPRRGMGANEIFKRLPGNNCLRCGDGSCMEFAVGMYTGRRHISECPPLREPENRPFLESLTWLVTVIGPVGGRVRPFRDPAARIPRPHLGPTAAK